MTSIPPLVIEFPVACSRVRAFALWTTEASRWWPKDHSFSADPGLSVVFEPRRGGRVYERTVDGTEYDWGEIQAWEPPHRLTYLWHIAGDRSDATEVEVTFTEAEDLTTVRIEHRGWERLGAVGQQRREGNHRGWESMIPVYIEAAASD